MTPERWARLKDLFGRALDLSASSRTPFLLSECEGDEGLRVEVERLLSDAADPSLDVPAVQFLQRALPDLAPGQLLGQYQIEGKLGQGGMGAVYLAFDTTLRRRVALKTLLPGFSAAAERRHRLMVEAQAASALNHPGIVTIYQCGSEDGIDFIAMEYVEGKPLAKMIPGSGFPVHQALDYAVQIADALAHAHAAGIVHRDLKPANVIITDEGRVKLLDFGLAQQYLETESGVASLSLGSVLAGTPAYMAPEQAAGKQADHRADIFAFGCILYEMLSGKRPFPGETVLMSLAAVLYREPLPLAGTVADSSGELRRIIGLCLRKDPARRLQSATDVRLYLEAISEANTSPASPRPAPSVSRRWQRWWLAAALLLGIGAGAVGVRWLVGSHSPSQRVYSGVRRLTAHAGVTAQPAISPDGKLVAYASDLAGDGCSSIWVQHFGGGNPVRLTHGPHDDSDPVFSPDGSRIAFRSERDGGGVYIMAALGGESRLLAPAGRYPQFSPDGKWISYYKGSRANLASSSGITFASWLFIIPASGGEPVQLRADFPSARNAIWAPDGKHLLFVGNNAAGVMDWWVTGFSGPAFSTGMVKRMPTGRRMSVPVPGAWIGDRVIYAADSGGESRNLWLARISQGDWQFRGSPIPLTIGASFDAEPSVSADGQVVFAGLNVSQQIWTLDIAAGGSAAPGPLVRLTDEPTLYDEPALSPDGTRMAYVTRTGEETVIRVKNLASPRSGELSAPPEMRRYPSFSHNGSRLLALGSAPDGRLPLYTASLENLEGTLANRVCGDCGLAAQWSPDARFIVFDHGSRKRVGAIELNTGRKAIILQHSAMSVIQPQLSPDGRWISFVLATQPDRTRLMIAPFRGLNPLAEADWRPLSDGAGIDLRPRWSPDGATLYFVSDRDSFHCIWGQRVNPASGLPVGDTFAVRHFHNHGQLLAPPPGLGFGVAAGKMIFNLLEQKSNIWTLRLPPELPADGR